MSLGFNADEVLGMAEQIERNGIRFYRAAAEAVEDEALKAQFLELAEMEADHERTFSAMRRKLTPQERQPTTFDPEDETQAYLAAMADANVFDGDADPTRLVDLAASPAEILRTAIGFERESILFYLGLERRVPERLGRDRIGRIIEEEQRHVALLRGRLAAGA
jgi:rubrerythrin